MDQVCYACTKRVELYRNLNNMINEIILFVDIKGRI